MRHFLDRDWVAPNVMRVPIDAAVADSFADVMVDPTPPGYHTERPHWNSDIRWISAANEATFARFQAAFDALDVARHVQEFVAVERQIRMYQGFVVLRSQCRKTDFHVDWDETGNQAFTLLTPIGPPTPGFGLVFKTLTEETRTYDYSASEALIFGDLFLHSTQPGSSDTPAGLLCFNFGTDRMEDWPAIKKTAGAQGGIVRRPDGLLE
jgi:hypothetical protein